VRDELGVWKKSSILNLHDRGGKAVLRYPNINNSSSSLLSKDCVSTRTFVHVIATNKLLSTQNRSRNPRTVNNMSYLEDYKDFQDFLITISSPTTPTVPSS
jgi:hypothetical protein